MRNMFKIAIALFAIFSSGLLGVPFVHGSATFSPVFSTPTTDQASVGATNSSAGYSSPAGFITPIAGTAGLLNAEQSNKNAVDVQHIADTRGWVVVAGGMDTRGLRNDVELFDLDMKIVSETYALKVGREEPSVVAYANKIYVIGGGKTYYGPALKSMEIIDPRLQRIYDGASLAVPLWGGSAVSLGKKIYLFGGRWGDWNSPETNVLQIYTPDKNKWSVGPAMPHSREVACTAVDSHIDCFGKRADLAFLDVYDTVTNSWSSRPIEHRSTIDSVAATPNGKTIYGTNVTTFGGKLNTTVYIYNRLSDTWSTNGWLQNISTTPTILTVPGAVIIAEANGIYLYRSDDRSFLLGATNVRRWNTGIAYLPSYPHKGTLPRVAGTVFLDKNKNGKEDRGERYRGSLTIELSREYSPIGWRPTMSDPVPPPPIDLPVRSVNTQMYDGTFAFTILPSGSYMVEASSLAEKFSIIITDSQGRVLQDAHSTNGFILSPGQDERVSVRLIPIP